MNQIPFAAFTSISTGTETHDKNQSNHQKHLNLIKKPSVWQITQPVLSWTASIITTKGHLSIFKFCVYTESSEDENQIETHDKYVNCRRR